MNYEVKIDASEVLGNLGQLTPKVKQALSVLGETTGAKMSTYAKQNARWIDRTSAARTGIKHECKWEGNVLSIGVMHQVDYGLWLEVRTFPHAGRLAILQDARDSQVQSFLDLVKRVLK